MEPHYTDDLKGKRIRKTLKEVKEILTETMNILSKKNKAKLKEIF